MIEEAEHEGQSPDVIVASCGGAIAALVANQIQSNEDRKELIESKVFYEFLRTNDNLDHTSLFWVLGKMVKMFWQLHIVSADTVPDTFSDVLLMADAVPERHAPESLRRPFLASGIRVVIVAGRMLFAPEDVGSDRNGRKLFQEVFFTDDETAELLKGFNSPVGESFAASSVMKETEVLPDALPVQATRASVADPLMVKAVRLKDGYYYATGAIDLYPLELAHQLADEVLMQFSSGFDSLIDGPTILITFRYDMNERLRKVTSSEATHWIDMTDEGEVASKYGFDLHANILTLSVDKMIPDDYGLYRERVARLWEFGKCRMRQALRTTVNGKAHIKHMDDRNTYPAIRQARVPVDDCETLLQ